MEQVQEPVNQEKVNQAFEAMFRTKGWKIFLEDLRNNAMQIANIEACKDLKDLYFRKGQLSIMGNILNFEEALKTAKEQAEAEETEEFEGDDEVSKSVN